MLEELRLPIDTVPIYGDNQAANTIAQQDHPSRAQRHWRIRADFIQDLVRKQIVSVHKIDSTDNPADNGTKLVYAYQW